MFGIQMQLNPTEHSFILEEMIHGGMVHHIPEIIQQGRVVNGDFDNDGKQDDIAAFYNYGGSTTQIHRWTSTGNLFNVSTFWPVSGYDVTKITNRVVSGDFDNDGNNDDIAAFYDYGSGNTRIHVWLGSPSGFSYQGSTGWWSVTNGGYDCNKITSRVVCGDFDHDGFQDDIAAFFNNGGSNTRIHVWKSTGSAFTYSGSTGWWSSSSLNSNLLTGRVVVGDFDQDNFLDDIAAFYDNGTGTNLRVWKSSGTAFTYSGNTGWWNVPNGYDTDNFTGRVVSGDFDRDDTCNDITVFYDRTNSCGSLRTNVWQSNSTSFSYINNSMGYPWLTSYVFERSAVLEETASIAQEIAKPDFNVYPNPFSNELTIQYELEIETPVEVSIYSSHGTLVAQLVNEIQFSGEHKFTWNLQNSASDKIESGLYYVVLKTDAEILTTKIICVE
ncbi:MAG: T9SS type A sorting domain-containing protein [Crocinitomicaceae bacterium]|nr:T9SS type A sorting domain-containing protein [Crocinitomicaceae bacterium]